jgi:hypothetical protein
MSKNVKKMIQNIKEEYSEPWNYVQKNLKRIMTLRVIVTLAIITWAIVLSYHLMRKPTEQEQIEERGEHRAKYFYMHRVWFGEESLVMIIFKIWVWVIILMLLSPLLRQLIIFLRVKQVVN